LPSPKGWLVLAGCALLLFFVATKTVYPFLAVVDPFTDGPVVVEGWVDAKEFGFIAEEFRQHGIRTVYTTGGPIDPASPLSEYHTFAELGAISLKRVGFPPELVQPVPVEAVVRDRTFSSAAALHRWMIAHQSVPARLTVMTSGAHARRTRLLFQMAFGATTKVGVIALPEGAFDPARWWTSSEGFRTVTGEVIAYAYARLIFWPTVR
jgi:hypothetical protein